MEYNKRVIKKEKRRAMVITSIPDAVMNGIPDHLDIGIFGKYFNDKGQKRCWMCKEYKDISQFYRKGKETRCKKCDAVKIMLTRARVQPRVDTFGNGAQYTKMRKNARALAKELDINTREMWVQDKDAFKYR